MKEIEVKFKVADIESVEQALISAGVELGEMISQDDTSFAPVEWKRGQSAIQVPFMRIRIQGDKTILTMKKPVENQLDRIEHEVTIDDAKQARMMIEEIGFTQDANVVKQRRKANYKGYEICVDRVERLGNFIEIEKLVSDETDGVAVQKEIRDVLVGLLGGSEGLDEVDRGYDILMTELESAT